MLSNCKSCENNNKSSPQASEGRTYDCSGNSHSSRKQFRPCKSAGRQAREYLAGKYCNERD